MSEILKVLYAEREKIDNAIRILEGETETVSVSYQRQARTDGRKRKWTTAQKRKLSAALKASWIARKAKSNKASKAA